MMVPKIGRPWLCWIVTTVIMVVYVGSGIIENHATKSKLRLTPGNSITLNVFRLSADILVFDLFFKAEGCQQRPELGDMRGEQRQAGLRKLARPGSDVRIRASLQTATPTIYQAMPQDGYCSNTNIREMTTNLSIEPGVWRLLPPQYPTSFQVSGPLRLNAGFNRVVLEVTTVESPIVGENVEVVVIPPVGAKQYRSAGFLLPGIFLWPLFVLGQVVWLLFLTWKRIERLWTTAPTA